MKKKSRFRIGDWVVARACVEFGIQERERRQFRIEREIRGQICGVRYRYIGEHVPGVYNDYEGSEPGYIKDAKGVLVWLVRLGMINKPLEVLDEDIELAVGSKNNIPWKYTSMRWSEVDRKLMSVYSKGHPRDEKGRFV